VRHYAKFHVDQFLIFQNGDYFVDTVIWSILIWMCKQVFSKLDTEMII